jgi:hypothetical protein
MSVTSIFKAHTPVGDREYDSTATYAIVRPESSTDGDHAFGASSPIVVGEISPEVFATFVDGCNGDTTLFLVVDPVDAEGNPHHREHIDDHECDGYGCRGGEYGPCPYNRALQLAEDANPSFPNRERVDRTDTAVYTRAIAAANATVAATHACVAAGQLNHAQVEEVYPLLHEAERLFAVWAEADWHKRWASFLDLMAGLAVARQTLEEMLAELDSRVVPVFREAPAPGIYVPFNDARIIRDLPAIVKE